MPNGDWQHESDEKKPGMAFKALRDKASAASAATTTSTKTMDEVHEALPTLRALGFAITHLRVDMGLLPDVGARLVASTDTIDVKKIEQLIEESVEKRLLVTALKGLLAAFNIKAEINDASFEKVALNITFGLPPRVSVEFVGRTALETDTGS